LKKLPKLEFLSLIGNPVEDKIRELRFFLINEMPKLKYLDWEPVTKEEKQRAIKLEGEGVWDDHLLPVRPSASSYNQESAGNEKKQSRDNEAKGKYSYSSSNCLYFTNNSYVVSNVHIHNSVITPNYSR
jgi:hypothetical protein